MIMLEVIGEVDDKEYNIKEAPIKTLKALYVVLPCVCSTTTIIA